MRGRRDGPNPFPKIRPLVNKPRSLKPEEIHALLRADVPARLATIDSHGFPHVTPLWFIWEEDAFHMTSFSDRPHLRRLHRNPQAGLCIDVEQREREDGQRPNQQVRVTGRAELFADDDGLWTRRITSKYVKGPGLSRRTAEFRTVIRLRPLRLIAVASV